MLTVTNKKCNCLYSSYGRIDQTFAVGFMGYYFRTESLKTQVWLTELSNFYYHILFMEFCRQEEDNSG